MIISNNVISQNCFKLGKLLTRYPDYTFSVVDVMEYKVEVTSKKKNLGFSEDEWNELIENCSEAGDYVDNNIHPLAFNIRIDSFNKSIYVEVIHTHVETFDMDDDLDSWYFEDW